MIDNYQGVQNNFQSKSFIYPILSLEENSNVYVSGKAREESRSAALQADSPFELPGNPTHKGMESQYSKSELKVHI